MNLTLTGFDAPADRTVAVPDLSAWKANAAAVLRAILKRAFDVSMDDLRKWGVDRAIEDGAAHRRIEETQTVDLEPGEAHVLAWFVGEAAIELHKARGEYAANVRDPRNDTFDRDGWKAVTVHYDEVLTARVISLSLEGDGEAEIEVTGEGSYWT